MLSNIQSRRHKSRDCSRPIRMSPKICTFLIPQNFTHTTVAARLVHIPPYGATVIQLGKDSGTRFCSRLLQILVSMGALTHGEFQNIKMLQLFPGVTNEPLKV